MRRTQSVTCITVCLSLLLCAGCQNSKKNSELDKNEKIHLHIDTENELSPDELKRQKDVRKQILDRTELTQKSEKNIQDAINNAKNILSENSFKQLQAAQNTWNIQGRGKDINKLVKNGIPAAEAYAQAAFDRAEWIQIRTSQAMLIEMPGNFGGFYKTSENQTLELYEMPENRLNLVIRATNANFTYTASGIIQNKTVRLISEIDPKAAVLLSAESKDIITVELDADFVTSQVAASGTLIEGRFERVKPGEFDVFAP